MANRGILEETVQLIRKRMGGRLTSVVLEECRVGVFFTGVRLESGHAGVAFTPVREIPEAVCCPRSAARMPDAGNLTRKDVHELLAYAMSPNPVKSAIGVALINALSQYLFENGLKKHYEIHYGTDGLDAMGISPLDTVCLVGAFTPYIRRLKTLGNRFLIIERTPEALRPEEIEYYRASGEVSHVLSECDVVIITGSAIVNHTIDGLLSQTRRDSRVGIIGPTASMVPDVFFRDGVDVMAGIRITDPNVMLRVLGEGGSGYHLSNACAQKVVFVKSDGGRQWK
ncbi:MAG: Fis family transcriptional regulator [Proteobacteria bacterium]|nr:Fis family transcriptional regulator [Pseudomonadota bacterium]